MASDARSSTRRLALATDPSQDGAAPDARLLAPPLKARGFDLRRQRWDEIEPGASGGPDAVLLLSLAEHTARQDEFRAWLAGLEDAGVPVFNPVPLLRWGLDRRYLEDLEEAGVPVVPTGWIERGGLVHLWQILEFEGWKQAVVKPMIPADAIEPWAVSVAEGQARDREFRDLVRERGMMVQEFLPEVRRAGVLGFCFLGGEFSHAVRRVPGPGELRIREERGGRVEPHDPPEAQVRQARAVLEKIDAECLVARVDAVIRRKKLVLLELDLLAPRLYLEHGEGAAERLAELLNARLG